MTAPRSPYPECPEVVSTPAISQSRLYALDGDDLVAVDLGSGQQLWRTAVSPGGFVDYGQIAVTHGLVFVGTNSCATNDPTGVISVFRSDTGAFVRNLSSPDADGLVGIEAYGKYLVTQYACGECGGAGRTVVYRLYDFSIAWQTPDERTAVNSYPGTSVVGGLSFEFAQVPNTTTSRLSAYRADTGTLAWTKDGPYTVLGGDSSDPGDARNLIVYGPRGALDLDPATGTTRFRLPAVTAFGPIIAVDAQRIYATCSADHDTTCAFSTTDGSMLWSTTDPSGAYNQNLTTANGLVYLDSGLVLSAATGDIVTTLATHPVIVGSGHVAAYAGGLYDRKRLVILAPRAD